MLHFNLLGFLACNDFRGKGPGFLHVRGAAFAYEAFGDDFDSLVAQYDVRVHFLRIFVRGAAEQSECENGECDQFHWGVEPSVMRNEG